MFILGCPLLYGVMYSYTSCDPIKPRLAPDYDRDFTEYKEKFGIMTGIFKVYCKYTVDQLPKTSTGSAG